MKRQIFLMRHGESIGNFKELDGLDTELTEKGKNQAKKAAEYLKKNNFKFDKIITSKLKRAIETSEIINKSFKLEIHQNAKLNERNKGDWTGKSKSDYVTEELKKRYMNDEDVRPPNGENYEDLQNRVYPEFEKILKTNKGNLLFVLHGNLNKTIFAKITNASPALCYRIEQKNCSINILNEDERGRLFIEKINLDTQ